MTDTVSAAQANPEASQPFEDRGIRTRFDCLQ
jgi:hypothetical protein